MYQAIRLHKTSSNIQILLDHYKSYNNFFDKLISFTSSTLINLSKLLGCWMKPSQMRLRPNATLAITTCTLLIYLNRKVRFEILIVLDTTMITLDLSIDRHCVTIVNLPYKTFPRDPQICFAGFKVHAHLTVEYHVVKGPEQIQTFHNTHLSTELTIHMLAFH